MANEQDVETVDQKAIEHQAERYQPALSERQAQVMAARLRGYDVYEMVEIFDWGVSDRSPTENTIRQALEPAREKANAAKRLAEDMKDSNGQ